MLFSSLFHSRLLLPRGGAVGPRPLSRLQQADPARTKHDAKSRGRIRFGFHPAHQCGKMAT